MIGGRYTLDREIGRGGMGAVWLARDEVLGRVVAVKQVGAQPGGSSPDLVRAEREARLAARINHPHVVAVFDLVDDDQQRWLVMEYIDGMPLSQLIATRGRLGPDETAALLAQAAEALTAAHEAGITHRDVKPSNILVGQDGQVKLSDFGIARAEQDASLTATGLVTGSPAYISPEVASGRPAGGASDVWSLGATAYHALTGHPPYDVSDNVLGALYRIVHEDPPPLLDGGWLTPFVTAAMTRDPTQRWSMAEVAEFLHAGPGAGASPRHAVPPTTTVVAPAPAAGEAPGHGTQPLAVTAPPVEPPTTGRPAGGRAAPRRRRSPLPLVVGALFVVLAAVIAFLLLDNRTPIDPGGSAGNAGESPSTASESPSEPAAPDADAMEAFVGDYLATADADPASAFQRLTPDYQDASGGLAGYEGFWGRVSNVALSRASADPDALTVTYTYSYDLDGSGRTDRVRMTLQQDGDGFLISDAVTL